MLRVIVHVPGGEDRKFRFSNWRTVIGRSRSCDLTLVSSQVSKTHAAIEIIEEAVTIRDLGSRNGIEVNGLAIQRQTQLHPGDKVTLGDVTISIDADSAIFHGGHTPNVRLRDLIKQEQHLRSSGHNPLVDPLQVDPTRLAIAGRPTAWASTSTRPIASSVDGSTSRSMPASERATSRRKPRKRT